MESGAHIKGIIMVVQITTTQLRKHRLYRMGLFVQKVRRTYLNGQTKSFALCLDETVCFMMVNNQTYVFDISKGHAQIVSKDLNTKSYMAEACSECP